MRTRSATTKTTRAPRPGQLLLAAAAATLTLALAPAAASATSAPHATSPTCTESPPAPGFPYNINCTHEYGLGLLWSNDGGLRSIGGGALQLNGMIPQNTKPWVWSAISATWVEPAFPSGSNLAIWPGIEGPSLVQAGTTTGGSGGGGSTCGTCFWGEAFAGAGDNGELPFNLPYTGPPVEAGDTVTVTLTRLGPGSWQVYVSNTTPYLQTGSWSGVEAWTEGQPTAVVNYGSGTASAMWSVEGFTSNLVDVHFCTPIDWLAATATTSTGVTVNALPAIHTMQAYNAKYGTCVPPPPPPPTCDPSSPPVGPVVSLAPDAATGGYWMATPFGEVISCHAPFMGSPASLSAPITAITPTPHGHGYWLVASDGGVFAYGSARFFGSLPGLPASAEPHSPVVSLVPTATGTGYYEVTANGDVYAFGAAPFYGSMGGVSLAKPVVGAALDPKTGGYWLVASDGGVFAFHAPFYGSMGGKYLAKPVVGISYAPSTGGYRLVASDGGVFSFDAPFHGSMGGQALAKPVVAIATTPGGYWEVGSDGGVFCFGSAAFEGSLG